MLSFYVLISNVYRLQRDTLPMNTNYKVTNYNADSGLTVNTMILNVNMHLEAQRILHICITI